MGPALPEDELPEDWEEAASDCMEADPTTASEHSSQHAVAHIGAEQGMTDHRPMQNSSTAIDGSQHAVAHADTEQAMTDQSAGVQDSSTAVDSRQHAGAHVEAEQAMTDHNASVQDSSTAVDGSQDAVADVEAEQGMTDHYPVVQDSSTADGGQHAVANDEEEEQASPDQGGSMADSTGAASTGSQHADARIEQAQVRPEGSIELVNVEGTAHVEAAASASSLPLVSTIHSDSSAKDTGNHFSLAVDDRQDAAALDAFTQAESANTTGGNPSGNPSAISSAATAAENNSIEGSCPTEADPPAHQAGAASDLHALDNLPPANVRPQNVGTEEEGVVESSVLANSLATDMNRG